MISKVLRVPECSLRVVIFDWFDWSVSLPDRSAPTTVTGMLKSIMKRKDGSNSGESRSTGKKSLQFVGILNGG